VQVGEKRGDFAQVGQLTPAGLDEGKAPVKPQDQEIGGLQRGGDTNEERIAVAEPVNERVRIHGKVLLRTTNAAGI
jgi:hypothetical protein